MQEGKYYICMNPFSENLVGNPDRDVSNYWGEGSCSNMNLEGYLVEVFIPVFSKPQFSKGMKVGFDVHVDYYESESDEVKDYIYWNGDGLWFQNPGALAQMTLVK